ncbi:MAG TPA: pyridoxal phosphate-dependent aminotransferase, partial [Anaeromyxobacter sp.]|nr:pyridoxal phosphate-dependent aminotransferase [Anaeromyxobacter sp.]
FAPTTRRAHAAVLSLLCRPGDAVLVPGSGAPFPHRLAARLGVEPIRYRLRHEGAWQLDRRELERAVTERTRAVVVASPSAPTGARLSARELAWLERLCAERRLALVGDESYADAATGEGPGVCEVTRCLGVHVSGLSTVCGLPRLPSWVALAGPAVEAGRAASRLETILGAPPGVALRALRVTPALLAARQHFLGPLARRLGENRALLARSALGEASFSVDQGGGGWWAVLHLGAAHEGEEVCRSLLTEDVVLRPWLLEGLPRHGYVVVSLLTPPDVLHQGLERLERHLRRPMF